MQVFMLIVSYTIIGATIAYLYTALHYHKKELKEMRWQNARLEYEVYRLQTISTLQSMDPEDEEDDEDEDWEDDKKEHLGILLREMFEFIRRETRSDQSTHLVTEEEMQKCFKFVEDESSSQRDLELQNRGYVKYKGKWYEPIQEDVV